MCIPKLYEVMIVILSSFNLDNILHGYSNVCVERDTIQEFKCLVERNFILWLRYKVFYILFICYLKQYFYTNQLIFVNS
jgi:hypothetical protein